MDFLKQIFGSSVIEILAVVTGVIYLFFSVRRNILLWLFGIITSSLYIYIYFSVQMYADMSLQVYYVIISMYGWYFWIAQKHTENEENFPVKRLNRKNLLPYFIATLIIFVIIAATLIYVPKLIGIRAADLLYWDAFTTATSVVATYMIAQKIIENWIIWIVIDTVSAGLYIYKELYPTVILFIIYTIFAVVGYVEWKKHLVPRNSGFSLNQGASSPQFTCCK